MDVYVNVYIQVYAHIYINYQVAQKPLFRLLQVLFHLRLEHFFGNSEQLAPVLRLGFSQRH